MKDAIKPVVYLLLVLLAISLVSLLFVGCSVIRKSQKDKTETHTKTESDSSATVTTKTETKTTVEADTALRIGGNEMEGDFTDHTKPFTLENEHQKVTIDKGKVTAIVKEKTVPVNFKKTTETKQEIKSSVNEKKKEDKKSEQKKKAAEVKKTGPVIPWWLWLILIPLAAGYLYWKFKPS